MVPTWTHHGTIEMSAHPPKATLVDTVSRFSTPKESMLLMVTKCRLPGQPTHRFTDHRNTAPPGPPPSALRFGLLPSPRGGYRLASNTLWGGFDVACRWL